MTTVMTKTDVFDLWRPILDRYGVKSYMLINRCEENYKESVEEYLAQYKKEVCVEYCKNSELTAWRTLLYQVGYPKYFCYGWVKDKSIGDYVILDVEALRNLHAIGKLNCCISEKVKNKDDKEMPYSFIAISIPKLLELPESKGVIAYHSDNHPALLDE